MTEPATAEDSTAKAALEEKLRQVHARMNKARVLNRKAIEIEDKLAHSSSNQLARERWEKREAQVGAAVASVEKDYERERIMNSTIAESEVVEKQRKRKAKNKAAFGWEVFNQDTLFKAHAKRVKQTAADMEAYEEQKKKLGDELFYNAKESATYGTISAVRADKIDEMAHELKERADKKKLFSRRRMHDDTGEVTSINHRNAVFNKKVARSYDAYTKELRDNVERGTAL
eukprot:TRINITY_DN4437_c0_g1_i1.p1 TRINITY_DN4437_c0_g1~~TRINITY_DN4437_c0_g1_i1.p1  ORF type:complete len:242 (-),score=60.36 TRINITY_DN4437_c0_g1_i1:146-835(-)